MQVDSFTSLCALREETNTMNMIEYNQPAEGENEEKKEEGGEGDTNNG